MLSKSSMSQIPALSHSAPLHTLIPHAHTHVRTRLRQMYKYRTHDEESAHGLVRARGLALMPSDCLRRVHGVIITRTPPYKDRRNQLVHTQTPTHDHVQTSTSPYTCIIHYTDRPTRKILFVGLRSACTPLHSLLFPLPSPAPLAHRSCISRGCPLRQHGAREPHPADLPH